jgi:hypothetical protein
MPVKTFFSFLGLNRVMVEDLEGEASVKRQCQGEVSIELVESSPGARLTQESILALIAPPNKMGIQCSNEG